MKQAQSKTRVGGNMRNFKALLLILLTLNAFNLAAFSGAYVVPTESDEDLLIARNEVSQIKFSTEALTFTLPHEVASPMGMNVRFVRDDQNPNLFKSAFGTANCLQETFLEVKCEVKYNKVYADFLQSVMPETERHLRELQLPADELQRRMDLARRFSGDPIGFLVIDLY